jgi:hypothetical protein
MVTQLAVSLAVHAQSVEFLTLILTRPPSRRTERPDGSTVNVHDVPGWLTVTCSPAIVILAFRCGVPPFDVAVKVTVPFPLPFAPPVIVIQEVCSVAVHEQPDGAATEKVELPPAAGTDRLVGVTE